MDKNGLLLTAGSDPLRTIGHLPQKGEDHPVLGEREQVLGWCVYAGPHLQEEGWLMLFRFPNGLQASVAFTPWTRGIEVGVMNGEWLVDVIEDLSGEDLLKALRSVMLRSLA